MNNLAAQKNKSDRALCISLREAESIHVRAVGSAHASFILVPELRARSACLQLLPGLEYTVRVLTQPLGWWSKAAVSPSKREGLLPIQAKLHLEHRTAALSCLRPVIIFDGMSLALCNAVQAVAESVPD
jgi:hypothetical protein